MAIQCPLRADGEEEHPVQKVSGIVATGSRDEWGSYGGYTTSVKTKTQLARSLELGPEPFSWFAATRRTRFFWPLQLFVGGFMVFIVFAIIASSINDYLIDNTSVSVLCAIPPSLLIASGYFFLAKWERKRVIEKDDQKKEAWKAARAIWENLYYCHRDDTVFNAKTGEYQPSEHAALLYRNRT